MASLNEIRTTFLEFFAGKDHKIVSSSPLVPHNDPTLLFTNAGMVQFKNVFTGTEARDYVRATTSQKCVRAGGKHNDLDNVGYTARHHTFFEMLGNFSFGDYFKEEAIEYAWELVTKVYELPPEKLLVTVYSEDQVAFDLWKKIAGLSEDKIIRIPTSDNFWAMGDTGPCGPCSEIFYDHGDHIPGGPPGSPDEDGDRFIEIWNLVFMQFEQESADKRSELPKPSIDTGMGLERIAAVLQGTHDNYQTDLFQNLIRASAETAGVSADGEHSISHRVIADHLRASSFLIADGVLPSNEGRGYVLRRIMRRGMRHAHILGAKDPLLWRLVPTLISEMGAAYPELTRAESLIEETLKLEEEKFRSMLGRGLSLLEEATADLSEGQALPGETAFKLYDTYGFPLDLTQDALRARNIDVDIAGFDAAMAKQREDARKAWSGSGEAATEEVWFDLRDQNGATEFLGYDTTMAEGQIQAIIVDGKPVETLPVGTAAQIVTNQTPFYGESGGQAGDIGILFTGGGASFIVTDTQKKLGDLHVHIGTLQKGTLNVADVVEMHVDSNRRTLTRSNHSATHLLHAALRNVLGDHVTQKGSAVDADRLRFDFSHPKAVTAEELEQIEAEVNKVVRQNGSVMTRVMTPDEAIEAGALALFGEKYGDEVRVLTMGESLNTENPDKPYSVELCGGTHVGRVGDIALFKIVSESAVASGVRRIEALTGESARVYFDDNLSLLREAAGVLKIKPSALPERVAALNDERKKLEREVAELKKAIALGGGAGQGAKPEAIEVNGIKLLAQALDGVSAKDLRGLIDDSKKQLGSGVVAFVAVNDGKAALAVGVTQDLAEKISAVDIVRAGVGAVGGKGGGGRPDMAQAGGPDGGKANDAIDAMKKFVEEVAA